VRHRTGFGALAAAGQRVRTPPGSRQVGSEQTTDVVPLLSDYVVIPRKRIPSSASRIRNILQPSVGPEEAAQRDPLILERLLPADDLRQRLQRLDLVPLDAEEPVDVEIEIGCVQLKEIAKERLQILKGALGSPIPKPYDPASPGWLAFTHARTISRNVPTTSTSSSTSIFDVLPTRS